MTVFRLGQRIPKIDPTAFVAYCAGIVGHVELNAHSSIWFNAVLRGDNEWIRIGAYSNVQEGVVMHTDPGHPVEVGEWVTIGHQAMLHGCTIGEGSLIGIQAVVLNGAVIGRNCLIGAGALIAEGKHIPDNSLVVGAPARIIRQLNEDDTMRLRQSAQSYVDRAIQYRNELRPIDGPGALQ